METRRSILRKMFMLPAAVALAPVIKLLPKQFPKELQQPFRSDHPLLGGVWATNASAGCGTITRDKLEEMVQRLKHLPEIQNVVYLSPSQAVLFNEYTKSIEVSKEELEEMYPLYRSPVTGMRIAETKYSWWAE